MHGAAEGALPLEAGRAVAFLPTPLFSFILSFPPQTGGQVPARRRRHPPCRRRLRPLRPAGGLGRGRVPAAGRRRRRAPVRRVRPPGAGQGGARATPLLRAARHGARAAGGVQPGGRGDCEGAAERMVQARWDASQSQAGWLRPAGWHAQQRQCLDHWRLPSVQTVLRLSTAAVAHPPPALRWELTRCTCLSLTQTPATDRPSPASSPHRSQESPTFFPTIEDFLWFKLGLLRSEGRAAGAGSFGGAGSAAGEAGRRCWRHGLQAGRRHERLRLTGGVLAAAA